MRRFAWCVTLVVLAMVAAAPAWAQDGDRSYRIGQVQIQAELRADGSMRVHESREFVYDGTYRGAFYELPLRGGQQVSAFGLTDSTGVTYQPGDEDDEIPGTYTIDQSGDAFGVTWFYGQPATDESRTYVLDYEITGAGTRHEDVAELYWKWVGTGWEVPTDRVTAEVTLPPGADALTVGDDLQIFGHGPLSGQVSAPSPGVVRTAVTNVPANQFVEVRALMPPELLAGATSDGKTVRDAILVEERCLADPQCDPHAAGKRVGLLATGGLLVAAVGGWLALYRRNGREHPLPTDLAPVETAPPSDHPPAVVSMLRNWNNPGKEALVATILDLARRGHVELVQEARDRGEELVFRYRSDAGELWERELQRLLFQLAGNGSEVSQSQLERWVSDHRAEAYAWWQEWRAELRRLPGAWVEPGRYVGPVLIGVALVIASIVLFVLTQAWVAFAGVVAGGVLIAMTPMMRRRTPEGRVLWERWQRYAAFLRTMDFRSLADRTPDALAQWGPQLVYAIPLGVAAHVARRMDLQLTDDEKRRVAGGWYPWYGHHGFAGGLDSVSTAVPSGAISSSPSSGGGGGLSGGGGGGGGGSGGGAF